MDQNQAKELLDKYLKGQCTPDERAIVEKAYNEFAGSNPVHYSAGDLHRITGEVADKINGRTGQRNKPLVRRLYPYAAAVLLFIITVSAIWYWLPGRQPATSPADAYQAATDVLPGGNKAYLMLSNGARIDLSTSDSGKLAAHLNVQKTGADILVYTPPDSLAGEAPPEFHTIVTPRGGQYSIQLPDGSRAWLNAASSLKFPSSFKGFKERKVALHGEGYFEVARDAARPFIVATATQQVTVLGTHFNINAYPDEKAVVTTLLEGAVSVAAGRLKPVQLVPGQQAVLKAENIDVQPADDDAVAWKNGKFKFHNTELPVLMRQISRWYDIPVVYEGAVPDKKFTGGINRSTRLSSLLQILKQAGITCVIEQNAGGKTLLVKNDEIK